VNSKELAKLSDDWWKARAARLTADKKAAELKAKESALKATILLAMKKDDVGAIGGKLVTVEYKPKKKPNVVDWPKFYAYIAKTKGWDLLQRRVGEAAVAARWDEKKTIPGVEAIEVEDFSYSQVKK
jgi:hypothetical protein